MSLVKTCADALQKRRFDVKVFDSAEEVAQALLDEIGVQSVGIGGSMTIKTLGVYDALTARGNEVHWHWCTPEGKKPSDIFPLAAAADVYLCSSNAITEDGVLVNIDGTGNRVAAMACGPKRVIVVAGRNKIAKDFQAAVDRIHAVSCPQNARRLNLQTPCAATGKCANCASPQRMCNVSVRLDYAPTAHPFSVYLVDADLGY